MNLSKAAARLRASSRANRQSVEWWLEARAEFWAMRDAWQALVTRVMNVGPKQGPLSEAWRKLDTAFNHFRSEIEEELFRQYASEEEMLALPRLGVSAPIAAEKELGRLVDWFYGPHPPTGIGGNIVSPPMKPKPEGATEPKRDGAEPSVGGGK